MTRHEEILNELVYRLDDLIYDFYRDSNELIANKSNQDRLIHFRDQTVETINKMNVRSLEVISSLRRQEDVIERGEKLIEKNEELIASSFEVIDSSPNKSELMEDLGALSASMYDSAKKVVSKVEESGVIDRFVNKTKEGLSQVANHPTVQKGTEAVKEKTKEAVDFGAEALKEGGEKISEWFEQGKEEVEEFTEKVDEFEDDFDDSLEDIEREVMKQLEELEDVDFLDQSEVEISDDEIFEDETLDDEDISISVESFDGESKEEEIESEKSNNL